MAHSSTNVSSITTANPEIVSVEKSPRRTPAQIAQDELTATLEKLEAVKARKERAEAAVASADQNIERLTALADYQASHPALKKADQEEAADTVLEPDSADD